MVDILNKAPYKGPDSYQSEDTELFHGRELDTFRMRTLVSNNRFSALHAPSGAGKTSLINASLVPTLEEDGYLIALFRPSSNPFKTAKKSIFSSLLPDPIVEAECIRLILGDIEGDAHNLTIKDLMLRLKTLYPDSFSRRQLMETLRVKNDLKNTLTFVSKGNKTLRQDDGLPDSYTPCISRLMSHSNGQEFFESYLLRVKSALCDNTVNFNLADSTSLKDILLLLEHNTVNENYTELVKLLEADERDLFAFTEGILNLVAYQNKTNTGVNIIIDQFEEFFTLYGLEEEIGHNAFLDNSVNRERELSEKESVKTYEMRREFFKQIGTLVRRKSKYKDRFTFTEHLPVKIIFSLRDEFYAKLDHPARFIGEIDRPNSFHLNLLSSDDCFDVIQMPAEGFNYEITTDLADLIVKDLSQADGYVDPGHIQIVCDYLWRTYVDGKPEHIVLDRHFFETVKGETVRGILKKHFSGFLAGFKEDDQKYDVLRILKSLFIYNEYTKTGTRKPQAKERLFPSRLVDDSYKDNIIRKMEEKRIIRSTSYKDMTLLEITHESLIGSIVDESEEFEKQFPEWASTSNDLERLDSISKKSNKDEYLSSEEVKTVFRYRKRLSVEATSSWLPGLTIKSLVRSGDFDSSSMDNINDWTEHINNENDAEELGASVLRFADDDANILRSYNRLECTYVLDLLKNHKKIKDIDSTRLKRLVDGLILNGNTYQARVFCNELERLSNG